MDDKYKKLQQENRLLQEKLELLQDEYTKLYFQAQIVIREEHLKHCTHCATHEAHEVPDFTSMAIGEDTPWGSN